MSDKDLLRRRVGALAVKNGRGFSLGHVAALPACNVRTRGQERLIKGGAGVLDRRVICRKDAADAYAWVDYQPLTANLTTVGATITAFGKSLIDDADAATARATLGITTPTAPALVYINGGTFSAAASATLDSVFSSTYQAYQILISEFSQSASANVTFKWRAGGTDASTNYYGAGESRILGSEVSHDDSGATAGHLLVAATGAALSGGRYTITATRVNEAANTYITMLGAAGATTAIQSYIYGGVHATATAYDGVKILAASGTITGRWRIYGIANS